MSIPIGVSQCLLGENVRYDGGHCRMPNTGLAPYVRYVAACPEVEIGMPVPREAVRLVQIDGERRLRGNTTETDWTEAMQTWAEARVEGFRAAGIRGYILKGRSPSCGMERLKVYQSAQANTRDGVGVFAEILMKRWPELPVEEDGRLGDARIRRNFITRLFVYETWKALREAEPQQRDLIAFHGRHKMLFMAHSPANAKSLGRMIAERGDLDAYETLMMATLKAPASRGRHVNVMQHLAGYAKDELSAAHKDEMAQIIDAYRAGSVPLEVPLTILRHHLRNVGDAWALAQVYLQPYPAELGLRSAVL